MSLLTISCGGSLSGILSDTEMKHLPELSCEQLYLWGLPLKINLPPFSSTNILQILAEHQLIFSLQFTALSMQKILCELCGYGTAFIFTSFLQRWQKEISLLQFPCNLPLSNHTNTPTCKPC